jgi:AI-2 transport protein TqsA
VVCTVIGLITGVLIWLLCLIMGLDFAFVWGFINFLLNYIPTLGAIIGVMPVSAFALVEFGIGVKALLVLLGISGIQIVMGIYLDPLLQGRQLSLSPLVVLFSVTFLGMAVGRTRRLHRDPNHNRVGHCMRTVRAHALDLRVAGR